MGCTLFVATPHLLSIHAVFCHNGHEEGLLHFMFINRGKQRFIIFNQRMQIKKKGFAPIKFVGVVVDVALHDLMHDSEVTAWSLWRVLHALNDFCYKTAGNKE